MRWLSQLLTHLQAHYDAHAAAVTTTGFSLFSGIQDRLSNMFWAIISGISVFLAVTFVKRLFKL